ncbi:amino acid ABC transporter permease [Kitasatospora viridis]|uniref:Amino acid ABC transporter membrane protein (PAAT family) n=1 Tax=Kitasatospora viridis TaxID=281105 RepID=A0A561UF21_9ACTN|nr:amino acid ABC transporter permease [Kitasatospora viridis]TWF97954.1 amino acid ABC transporter membrane protein (PAAT family) [Kitasatospora viridis]
MKPPPQGVPEGGRPALAPAVPVRHPGRWAGAVVVAVLAAMLLHALVANPQFHWPVIRQYLFDPSILHGLGVTLELTALAMLIGVAGGTVLAIMRLSPNPVLSGTAWFYVWVFRGTPLLVQLLFWNFLGALWNRLSIGVPFGGALGLSDGGAFWSADTNKLIPLFVAALLGLGLNEAAYMAEIIRGGIQSVSSGQTEAALALGMRQSTTMRRIVLPQAMRVIIPPTGNETISMLKTTSLVSAISLEELLRAGENIYSRTFQTIPLLVVVSIWYLFLTSVLTVAQYYVERYYARGANRALPPTPPQRLYRLLRGADRRTGGPR